MSRSLSSFGLPGEGFAMERCGTYAEAIRKIKQSHARGLPVIPIGGGTNCAFLEKRIPAVFLRSTDRSLRIRERKSGVTATVGAGLPWDTLVRFAVKRGWSGAECLSGIPGACGAAPVQNIGAYGVSLSDIIESVRAVDLKTLRLIRFSKSDCRFGYRTSIFNGSRRGRFFIISVAVRFGKRSSGVLPQHPDLKAELPADPTLGEVRNTVLRVRRRKLPDYKKIPNCGSFFKNPTVPFSLAQGFLRRNPAAPHWPESGKRTKLSAAWLIKNSGVRNTHWGKIRISPRHALILINQGETDHRFLRQSIAEITQAVEKKFGVLLEPEPNLLTAAFAGRMLKAQI